MNGLQKEQDLFIDLRPTMKEANTLDRLVELHGGEEQEFLAEYKKGNVVGMERELADMVIFCYAIASAIGVSLDAAVLLKMARNIEKYPPGMFQSGSYDEAVKECRLLWQQRGGDEAFYDNQGNS